MGLLLVVGVVAILGAALGVCVFVTRRPKTAAETMRNNARPNSAPQGSAPQNSAPRGSGRPSTQVRHGASSGRSPAPRNYERAHLAVQHNGRTIIAPLSEHPFQIGRSDDGIVSDDSRLLLPDPSVPRGHALVKYVDGATACKMQVRSTVFF